MKRILALAMLLLLLCGCAAPKQEETPTPAPPTAEEPAAPAEEKPIPVNLAINRKAGLDPFDCTDPCNRLILEFLYEPLFVTGSDYTVRPVAAESYTVSDDGMTTTVKLRRDLEFSTGEPVTAEDVLWSLERATGSAYYGSRFACVTDAEATDAHTVTLTTRSPMECLPRLLDIPVARDGENGPVGTGAYAYDGSRLTRITDREDLPQTVGLAPVTAPDGLRDGFQYGSVTLTRQDPNGSDAVGLTGDCELWSIPTTSLQYLGFSTRCPAALRSAVTYVVDREAIVAEDMGGFGTAVILPAPPDSPWYQPGLSDGVTYDPEKLKSTVPAGTALTLIVNSANAQRTATARRIADALRACSLNVTVQELSRERFEAALTAGDYDLYYGEIRLSPDFDLSPVFGIGGETVQRLCEAARANSGNAYDLQVSIRTDGLICPVAFKTEAVYGTRGLKLPVHPNLNGWILCE